MHRKKVSATNFLALRHRTATQAAVHIHMFAIDESSERFWPDEEASKAQRRREHVGSY